MLRPRSHFVAKGLALRIVQSRPTYLHRQAPAEAAAVPMASGPAGALADLSQAYLTWLPELVKNFNEVIFLPGGA